ncbi:MAG: T9SS type A sorting domain-containing protein [Bacteroidia bacterium]
MKRIILTFTIFIVAVTTATAQIPNAGFENWSAGANAAPDGWVDFGFSVATVSRSTDKYLGSYAIKVENKVTAADTTEGLAYCMPYPVATRYTALTGYYKYTPLNGDTALVLGSLTKAGYVNTGGDANVLGVAGVECLAAATYTPFSVAFDYDAPTLVPDSGSILIFAASGGAKGNSVLLVDALNYNTFTSIDEALDITQDFALYPNPISDGNFEVRFSTMEEDFVTVRIFDMNAKEVMNLFSGTMPAGKHEYRYNLSTLNSGNYLYMVSSGKGFRVEKICIQK